MAGTKQLDSQIISLVQQFKQNLSQSGIKADKVMVFGSYARGNQHEHSDIDVAVIAPNFGADQTQNYVKLRKLSRKIDLRIEPHAITSDSYAKKETPFAEEVDKYGIVVQ